MKHFHEARKKDDPKTLGLVCMTLYDFVSGYIGYQSHTLTFCLQSTSKAVFRSQPPWPAWRHWYPMGISHNSSLETCSLEHGDYLLLFGWLLGSLKKTNLFSVILIVPHWDDRKLMNDEWLKWLKQTRTIQNSFILGSVKPLSFWKHHPPKCPSFVHPDEFLIRVHTIRAESSCHHVKSLTFFSEIPSDEYHWIKLVFQGILKPVEAKKEIYWEHISMVFPASDFPKKTNPLNSPWDADHGLV